ncbi:thiamine pyrophosphate-binding protein [Methanosphaera sp.]
MKINKNIAQYLVDKLESYGVEYVFGYPGEQIIPIYEALRKSNIKHVLMRHEQGAVHAADAYARITGKYGVCLATAGPGAMNLVMGVSAAFKDNVPLIVITGDVSKKDKGTDSFQDLDINTVFKPITLKSFYSSTPEKLENNIEEIFNNNEQGITGPFHINIPKDIQIKPMNVDHKVIKGNKIKATLESDVEEVIKLIEDAEKPLIIAGSGVNYAQATEELIEFVEKTKIPLTTTYHARGIISEENKRNLGLIGNRGTNKANYASEHADLILAFGSRLSDRTISHINTENIVQINTKKEQNHAKYFYHNNIKEFLGKLNEKELPVNNNKWKIRINNQDEIKNKVYCETEKLHPEKVIETILAEVDNNITMTIDAGTTPTYLTIDSTLTKQSQMLFPGGFGPMGYSLPASIGASFARPNDIIFATTGDGSIQMTIQELAVISTYKLPIIIFIINNSLLGIIKQWQDMADLPQYQVTLNNPDFLKIAEAYNIESDNITSLEELTMKIKEAKKNKKPHIFNIDVDDVHIPLP